MRTEDRTGASLPAAPGGGPARPAALPLLPTLESAWPALCAVVAGLCLWLWAGAIGDVNPRQINDIGLASVLPGRVPFALILLTVSLCVLLHPRPLNIPVAALHLGILICTLYGGTPLLGDVPRFALPAPRAGRPDHLGPTGR